MNSISKKIFSSINGINIAIFRFLFGLVIFWEVARLFIWNDYAYYKYINTVFHFKYPYFEWVKQAPDSVMYYIIALVAFLALLFSVGLFHKVVGPLLFMGYTYLELIDISYWNNHYYFYSLLLFLFIFIRPSFIASYKIRKMKFQDSQWWELNILKFLVVLVLFFGGIAKLSNADWMNGSATYSLISVEMSKKEIYLSHSTLQMYAWFTLWFGIGIDLFTGFLLLHRKTIIFALLLLVPFNILNAYLFNIGSFPYAMLSALLLFFPKKWFDYIFKQITFKFEPVESKVPIASNWKIFFIALFVFMQTSLPLRHFFIEGNAFWTGEGKLYAWHMMSGVTHAENNGFIVTAMSPYTNEMEQHTIDLKKYLSNPQIRALSKFPFLAYQFAQLVKYEMESEGYSELKVYSSLYLGKNGKKTKPVISPFTNLLEVDISYTSHNDWILLYLEEGN